MGGGGRGAFWGWAHRLGGVLRGVWALPPPQIMSILCREEDPDDVPHGHITSLVSYGILESVGGGEGSENWDLKGKMGLWGFVCVGGGDGGVVGPPKQIFEHSWGCFNAF